MSTEKDSGSNLAPVLVVVLSYERSFWCKFFGPGPNLHPGRGVFQDAVGLNSRYLLWSIVRTHVQYSGSVDMNVRGTVVRTEWLYVYFGSMYVRVEGSGPGPTRIKTLQA